MKKIKPLAMPFEISGLDNLECYVKLPEGFPITKLAMTYKDLPRIAEPYVPHYNQNVFAPANVNGDDFNPKSSESHSKSQLLVEGE